jgi:SAM-dependent methyltransferase
MRLFYRIAYWIGFTPWERMNSLPIYSQLTALIDREESERTQPFGKVLDLGCGTGFSAVKLAKRGWQVTGIDLVAKALSTARKRALEAGVQVQLAHGDITALKAAGVGSGFEFFLDLGAVHGLDDAERRAVGREVTAVAAPGATLLMVAWAPGRRGPFPRGASRQDIEAAFPDWTVIAEEAADVTGAPGPVKRADPRFYRLRHNFDPSGRPPPS